MNAEALTSSTNLDVFTIDTSDHCNSTHFQSDTDDAFMAATVISNEEATYATIDLTTLVREQVRNHFCRQI